MLNFNQTTNVAADNKVSFCGIEYMITDDEATKLKSILDGMLASRGEAPKATRKPVIIPEEEKKAPAPTLGKPVWQEDFITVTDAGKDGIRLYLTVPALLYKKGEKLTPAQAKSRAKFLKDQLKDEAKQYGAVWAGNFEKLDIFWTFPTKKAAGEYIKARKQYVATKKVEA